MSPIKILSIRFIMTGQILALLGINIFAQQKIPDKTIALKADEYINERVRQGTYSGAVLIARGGKTILSKGYGAANLEFNAPNTPQTKFRLASLTKQFTATAIMILHERGQLDIEDSVCRYVSPCPDAWQAVTLKHLLNHTSGITEFGKPQPVNDCFRRSPMTVTATLDRARTFAPDFKPGEKFAYSSQAFNILGAIVEKVSGKTYENFLKENIFAPLGMNDTGLDHQKEITRNRAAGYQLTKDGTLRNFDFFNLDYLFAAGLYSTIEDLYLWEQAFYTEKLVKQTTIAKIFTPGLENFGYGWEIFPKFNRTLNR
ncbi:MAG TPA: serine hydrolase domain-containing protein, partial [Pyrinomonadaceae bacterium]